VLNLSPEMYPAVMVTIVMCGLQLLPEDWRAMIRYDRVAVAEGEYWRVLSSNFVHLGWGHLVLNATALLIIASLFGVERRQGPWLADLLICGAATGAGLYGFNPEVLWCVGLSGALHGLFVIGAVTWLRAGIGMGKWLLLGVIVKVLWEQFVGAMPFTGDIVGGRVVTDAHLWGALGALPALLVVALWSRVAARL
jgi:rhomboid family GlyGly-CTERM serine protease